MSIVSQKFLDYAGLSRLIDSIKGKFASYVPTSRKINGYQLSRDVELDAYDVGAVDEEYVKTLIDAAVIESWIEPI